MSWSERRQRALTEYLRMPLQIGVHRPERSLTTVPAVREVLETSERSGKHLSHKTFSDSGPLGELPGRAASDSHPHGSVGRRMKMLSTPIGLEQHAVPFDILMTSVSITSLDRGL